MHALTIALAASLVALPAAAALRYGATEETTVSLTTRDGMRRMSAHLQEVTFTEPGGGKTFANTFVSAYDPASRQYWWSVVRGLERHPAEMAAVREATLPSWTFVLADETLVAFSLAFPLLNVRPLSMRFSSQDEGDAFVKATHLEHVLAAYHPVTINAPQEWKSVNVIEAVGRSFRTVDPEAPQKSAVSLIEVVPENGKWYVTLKNGECTRRVITLSAAFALENE